VNRESFAEGMTMAFFGVCSGILDEVMAQRLLSGPGMAF